MAYNGGSDPTLAEMITAKMIAEMYSPRALFATKSKLVCVNAFNTGFRSQLVRGSKVNIPVYTSATASEVTPGTQPTSSDLATTAVSVTIDKWYKAAAEITPLEDIEQSIDYLNGAVDVCSYAVAASIDTDVNGLFSTLASSSVYGSDGQTFSDTIFRALVQTLDEADVPDDGRSLIGDPSTKSDILNIDKFVTRDYVPDPLVPGGVIERIRIYGNAVYITNNLTAATTGSYGVLAHKDAIGVVIQKNMNVKVWDLGWKFINQLIVDCAWGADEIRDTFGKSFYTRSK